MNRLVYILFIALFPFGLTAQDVVEWRGPGRSGVYADQHLLEAWPDSGPECLLEITGIGAGYSSAVVYNNLIYVTGKKDTLDVVSAYSFDGEKKWETNYGRAWAKTYPETRSTPTIENNRIFLASGMGEVSCVDAISGELIWSVDAHDKYNGEFLNWGIAESVAITDKAVLYVTGGEETSVVALDKQTGRLIWKTKSVGGPRAYASTLVFEHNGLKMALAQTANDLIAIDVTNGDIIWVYNLSQYHTGRTGRGANTNTPLYCKGEIFVTSGYDHPGLVLKLSDDGRSVSLKWKNDLFDNHIGGVVAVNGKIYGSNWTGNAGGSWMCVDWDTGETNYEAHWMNKGSIIAADNRLYCYEEKNGNLALVKPNPEKFDIVSTFKVEKGEGPHWAHPSIFDGKLYIRHGENLMVYKISE